MPPRILRGTAAVIVAAIAIAGASQRPVKVECPRDGVLAEVWPHPEREGLCAALCRDDPHPKWRETLLIVASSTERPRAVKVPLFGTGVERFEWLDCAGPPAAYLADVTHMGTIRDGLVVVRPGPAVELTDTVMHAPGTWSPRSVDCPAGP